MGWAVWAGTMVKARDWAEVRLSGAFAILFGASLSMTLVAFSSEFDFGRAPTLGYGFISVLFTVIMAFFYWRQERRRPNITMTREEPR